LKNKRSQKSVQSQKAKVNPPKLYGLDRVYEAFSNVRDCPDLAKIYVRFEYSVMCSKVLKNVCGL